jgi:hypothetical protein
MLNLKELESNFGTVEFEGMKYWLTNQADHTNRLLPYNGYNDKDENGNYNFEMSASAVDEKGNEYKVYWIFNTEIDEDGTLKELDEYDYDSVDRVELL